MTCMEMKAKLPVAVSIGRPTRILVVLSRKLLRKNFLICSLVAVLLIQMFTCDVMADGNGKLLVLMKIIHIERFVFLDVCFWFHLIELCYFYIRNLITKCLFPATTKQLYSINSTVTDTVSYFTVNGIKLVHLRSGLQSTK